MRHQKKALSLNFICHFICVITYISYHNTKYETPYDIWFFMIVILFILLRPSLIWLSLFSFCCQAALRRGLGHPKGSKDKNELHKKLWNRMFLDGLYVHNVEMVSQQRITTVTITPTAIRSFFIILVLLFFGFRKNVIEKSPKIEG
jgi:hypothetical protein